jgi:predicted MFS family arabinose efflux permease
MGVVEQPGAARRVGFAEVIGVPEFRSMWFAEILSIFGDQLARVALSVLVYGQTRSALLSGLAYAMTFVPSLLGGIALTGLADRFPRRTVMVATDAVRCLLVGLAAIPQLPLPLMIALVACLSLLNPPFKAAQLALLPQVLEGERFPVGLALRNISTQSAQLAGFAGGGTLMIVLDPHLALLVDAVTFLLSAVLVRLGVADRPVAAGGTRRAPLAAIGAGARLAFGVAALRTLVLFTWLAGFVPVYEGLAAPYAAVLGGGSVVVGLILASDPLGSVLGAWCYARWVPESVRPRLTAPLTVLAPIPLLACFLHPGIVVSVLLFVLTGGLGTVALLQATASLTVAIPDHARGQVLGLSNTGLTTVMGLVPLLGGALAQRFGPSATIGAFGVAGVLLGAALAWAWRRVGAGAVPAAPAAAER